MLTAPGSLGNINYWNQYLEGFSFSVSDGTTGYSAAPSLSADLFGSPVTNVLATTVSYNWFDANMPGTVWHVSPQGTIRLSETHRWYAPTVMGSFSSSSTTDVIYYDQYYVTFAVSPSGSGTAPASNFFNAGTCWTDSITATPSGVLKLFPSWSATSGITIASSTSGQHYDDCQLSGTVTANFLQSSSLKLSMSSKSLSIAPGKDREGHRDNQRNTSRKRHTLLHLDECRDNGDICSKPYER